MQISEKFEMPEGCFYCIGVSYKTADESIRGIFSLTTHQKRALLEDYKAQGIRVALVISTCNRTEIYAIAKHPFQLIKDFIGYVQGDITTFEQASYIYKNNEAISHFFRVGTGLDSQILGDFEIISQIRSSFKLSKKAVLCNAFLERLFNGVIQASKRVKNETKLSSGVTSVAFAAVQYILNSFANVSEKNILLFGLGKIGHNTCENLMKHVSQSHITLVNRTEEKAQKVARKFKVDVRPLELMEQELAMTDVLVVATSAPIPTITKDHIPEGKEMLILDLSIPKNVDEEVSTLPGIKVLHIDELSQMTDETLEQRELSVPDAEKIVEESKEEFQEWLSQRRFAPVLKALKTKLNTLKDAEIELQSRRIDNFQMQQAEVISDRFIQKITTHFANYFKEYDDGDAGLKVIEHVFQLQSEEL